MLGAALGSMLGDRLGLVLGDRLLGKEIGVAECLALGAELVEGPTLGLQLLL